MSKRIAEKLCVWPFKAPPAMARGLSRKWY